MTTYPTLAKEAWIRSSIVEEKEMQPIKFYAEVDKVQTMAEGSIRIVLGLGEEGRKVMEVLTECKQKGIVLEIVATPKP